MQTGADLQRPRPLAAPEIPPSQLTVLRRGDEGAIVRREGEVRCRIVEADVRADGGFRLDRKTDLFQRRGVSDSYLSGGSAKVGCLAGREEDDKLRPVFRESHSRGDSVDGRLGQLLMRSRVDQANGVVSTDREGSPVRAIRNALARKALARSV